jgi:prolyl 4-hydroxylase
MVTGRSLDSRWVAWLREWIQRGGDMTHPVLEMRRQGISDADIVRGLEAARPKGDALANGAMQALPLLRRAPHNLKRVAAADFPLYTLTDFLDPAECAALIELTAPHLQPSPLARAHYDAAFRTSTTAYLYEVDDPRAAAVDDKICRTLGIRAGYSEGIQVQRYEVGQQFKPHLDCFEPGTNTYERYAGVRGNRTWTFMVYLNDDLEGGATRFTVCGHAIQPRTGMALFWNNLHEDGTPNKNTMHCGETVTRGCKVIITKWFRVHGDGPVLHEHPERL